MNKALEDLGLKPNERAALEELKARLRECFSERLLRIVLFGSKARGESGEDSDLDVLILIRGYDRMVDGDAVHSIAFDVDLRLGVFTQTVEYSEREYQHRVDMEIPLVTNIEREGVPL